MNFIEAMREISVGSGEGNEAIAVGFSRLPEYLYFGSLETDGVVGVSDDGFKALAEACFLDVDGLNLNNRKWNPSTSTR